MRLQRYLEGLYNNRPTDSDINIFRDALKTLEEYDGLYYLRKQARKAELGDYDSEFERDVHMYLQSEINPLFIHDKAVVDAIGKREIILKDENDNDIIRKVHHALHYDCYLELTEELRELFGLGDQWKAIAVEGQGSYWHGDAFPEHQERDAFKREISGKENIIEIEIWDNWDREIWLSEFIRQINEQAGTQLTANDFTIIRNYLGN